MRENLIPEMRTDKNGRLIKRWVKPGEDTSALSTKIPAPAMTQAAPTVDYRADILTHLRESIMTYGDNPKPFIAKASDHILAYVLESLDEGKNDYFAGEISSLLSDNTEEEVIEAYINLYDFHNGQLDDMEAVPLLRGAMRSGTNPPEKYDRTDTKRNEGIKNMFRFLLETDQSIYAKSVHVRGVKFNTYDSAFATRVNDPKVADFIIENGDKTGLLIDIANEHPKEFTAILDAASTSPKQLKEIRDLFVNHPERVEGRDPSDVREILEASKNWTPVSEGTL